MHSEVLLYTPANSGAGYLRRMHLLATSLARQAINTFAIWGTEAILPQYLIRAEYKHIFMPRMRFDKNTYLIENENLSPIYTSVIENSLSQLHPKVFAFSHHLGVANELLPIHNNQALFRRTARVLIWRDILKSPATIDEWKKIDKLRFIQTLRNDVDYILVFGQEDLFDCKSAFSLPEDITSKIYHLGYVAPDISETCLLQKQRGKDVVISFGGGENRENLVNELLPKVIKALTILSLKVTIYTGLFWTPQIVQNVECLAASNVVVKSNPNYDDFIQHLAECALAINAGGYNSVVETLYLGTPLIVLEASLHNNGIGEVITRNQIFETHLLYNTIQEGMSLQRITSVIEQSIGRDVSHIKEVVDFNGRNNFVQFIKTLL